MIFKSELFVVSFLKLKSIVLKSVSFLLTLSVFVGIFFPLTVSATTVEEYCLENELVHGYMTTTDYSADTDYETSTAIRWGYQSTADYIKSRPAPVSIHWGTDSAALSYKVIITGSNFEKTYETTENNLDIYNLVPGREYNYKIISVSSDGERVIEEKTFITTGKVRMLYIDNLYNVRDLGGWTTSDGKTVKYGFIFRGTELDGKAKRGVLSETGRRQFDELNIITEIDLDESENATLDDYNHNQVAAYSTGLEPDSRLVDNYRNNIELIADRIAEGKGVYFHCQAGKDRTGTLAFLLLGLLGVTEDQISMDYELTMFNHAQNKDLNPPKGHSSIVTRNVYTYSGGSQSQYRDMIMWFRENYPGDSLNEKIENYCLSIGVLPETIAYLRETLLYSKPVSINNLGLGQYNQEKSGIRVFFDMNSDILEQSDVLEIGSIVRNPGVSGESMSVDKDGNLLNPSGQFKTVIIKNQTQTGNLYSKEGDRIRFTVLLTGIKDLDKKYDFRAYAIYRDYSGEKHIIYTSSYRNLSYNLFYNYSA